MQIEPKMFFARDCAKNACTEKLCEPGTGSHSFSVHAFFAQRAAELCVRRVIARKNTVQVHTREGESRESERNRSRSDNTRDEERRAKCCDPNRKESKEGLLSVYSPHQRDLMKVGKDSGDQMSSGAEFGVASAAEPLR